MAAYDDREFLAACDGLERAVARVLAAGGNVDNVEEAVSAALEEYGVEVSIRVVEGGIGAVVAGRLPKPKRGA